MVYPTLEKREKAFVVLRMLLADEITEEEAIRKIENIMFATLCRLEECTCDKTRCPIHDA